MKLQSGCEGIFLLVMGCVLAGCTVGQPPPGPLAVPPKNTVSVIVGAPAAATPDRMEWTWSVLGERNWTRPSANGTNLTLSDTYPINDVQRLHGTNTWNCDLVLQRDKANLNQADWTLTLHGSNGRTAQSQGALPLNGADLGSLVSVEQTRDGNSGLPATFPLAHLGTQEVTVAITK